MPSFLIRGFARYFAASAMESRARHQSSYTPSSGSSSDDNKRLSTVDLASWQTHMRWLIPLVQSTGNQVVIENPKSHEQIIIDQYTKELPNLTLKWMQKYNKQELTEWVAHEKERQQLEEVEKQKILKARRIEEARGRARFGNSFTLEEQNNQEEKNNILRINKENLVIPILCLYTVILVLTALWVYKSQLFAQERYEKDNQKYYSIMNKAENSPITELLTPEGFRFDMNEDEFNSLNDHRKTYDIENLYGRKYDWQFGNVHYAGEINHVDFHEGELYNYAITIKGRMINYNYSKLTDNDVTNICNYYKAFLKKDYTFRKLSDLSLSLRSKVLTYVFMKNNMVITLRYESESPLDDYIRITCENRPVSAPIERERRLNYKHKRYVPPNPYHYP